MGDINTPYGPYLGGPGLSQFATPSDVAAALGQAAADAWAAAVLAFLNPVAAVLALWRYVATLKAAVAYLAGSALQPAVSSLTAGLGAAYNAIVALRDAVNRTAWWVWTYMIVPTAFILNTRINQLRAWTVLQLAQLRKDLTWQILQVKFYATVLFTTERQARIKDVVAARAYALALNNALHTTIEHEAASGYRAGKGNRSGPLGELVAELHLRGLIDGAVNALLVKAVAILATTGDPALEAVIGRAISAVIRKSGVGDDLGNYLYGLIIPGQGGPDPKNLPAVVNDVAHRLGAIEDWITAFMLAGGPEVKDAGKQWKNITALSVDAALLAFLGQAVAAPQAWAREVSDTVGVVANGAIGGIVDLIHKA